MKLLFISVVALCLAGCATEAVLPSQAKQAPKERLLKFQSPGVGEQAKLIVVRDKGFLGSGCFVGVYLNQEKAAILDPGEKAEFYLNPGEWNVALMGEGKMCIADKIPAGRDFMLTANTTKAVRLFADPSGNTDVKTLPNQ
ncbi:hypothetical protein HV097_04575 [Enterobacter roggenkampii]|uniref:hypothetical protein n=1 Tax=Enterobacter roggenkampii TaxID=1812935 RepID=UPI0015E98427|nr:hypothetical protein [Enterobacter roggenkampii]QMR80091.1 hypothetical protein HV097_04575 [Enterobacter roggenkampii]